MGPPTSKTPRSSPHLSSHRSHTHLVSKTGDENEAVGFVVNWVK